MSHREYSIGRFISIIYRYRNRYLSKKLEPYHIGSGQYVYLLSLFKSPGMSQDALSDYLKIDKTSTAKSIKKLMNNGYVERKTDEKDKRAYQVYLTDKGHAIIPKILEFIKEWEDSLTDHLKEEEVTMIKDKLHKMAHNACDIDKWRFKNEEEN